MQAIQIMTTKQRVLNVITAYQRMCDMGATLQDICGLGRVTYNDAIIYTSEIIHDGVIEINPSSLDGETEYNPI